MQDLIFTPTQFYYPLDKTRAFRNYLSIVIPEIVNMPNLGYSPQLFDSLTFASSPKVDLIRNAIFNGASQYNIVVKAYSAVYKSSDGSLTFDDLVLG